MGDPCLMGANSNAWDSRLAQRHTSTCKRAKSTESSISAHELSLVMQALGNLNSVELDTFTHESPSTIKASKVLSEDHSFCKRLKPCTRTLLFVKGSIPMCQAAPGSSWQNRLPAVTRRFMPGEAPAAVRGRAFIKKVADSATVALRGRDTSAGFIPSKKPQAPRWEPAASSGA